MSLGTSSIGKVMTYGPKNDVHARREVEPITPQKNKRSRDTTAARVNDRGLREPPVKRARDSYPIKERIVASSQSGWTQSASAGRGQLERERGVDARGAEIETESIRDTPNGCERRWYAQLRRLQSQHPTLFSGQDDRLLLSSYSESWSPAYFGIGVTLNNCLDLRQVYEVYYKPRLLNGGRGKAEFKLVMTAVSQYMRWLVSTCKCSKWEVWKENTLFRGVASLETVESFLSFLSQGCSPGTMSGKAKYLKRVSEVGMIVSRDKTIRKGCELVSLVLRSHSNASKRAYRIVCRERKSWKHRSKLTTLMSHDALKLSKQWATEALDFIMRSYWRYRRANMSDSASVIYSYAENWSVNIIALLVLASGGQRPQVFCQLQLPSKFEYEQYICRSNTVSHIELRTLHEKRPRHLDLPNLILPATVIPYLRFHMEIFRPTIMKRFGSAECRPLKPLLIHTNTAKLLKPPEITTAFRKFMSSHNENLCRVTTMDVRRSYASMMHEKYHRSQVFKNLSETAFLKRIACQMNTSPEQLKRTYMGEIDPHLRTDTAALVNFWASCLNK